MGQGPALNKKERRSCAPAFLSAFWLCVTWPAASCSCHHAFPAMLDQTLNSESKFYHSNKNVTNKTGFLKGELGLWVRNKIITYRNPPHDPWGWVLPLLSIKTSQVSWVHVVELPLSLTPNSADTLGGRCVPMRQVKRCRKHTLAV